MRLVPAKTCGVQTVRAGEQQGETSFGFQPSQREASRLRSRTLAARQEGRSDKRKYDLAITITIIIVILTVITLIIALLLLLL